MGPFAFGVGDLLPPRDGTRIREDERIHELGELAEAVGDGAPRLGLPVMLAFDLLQLG